MATCNLCFKNFPDRRKNLGFNICIECGDKKAQVEIERKAMSVAPLFNKGAYQYIGSIDNVKHIGR